MDLHPTRRSPSLVVEFMRCGEKRVAKNVSCMLTTNKIPILHFPPKLESKLDGRTFLYHLDCFSKATTYNCVMKNGQELGVGRMNLFKNPFT